MNRTLPQQKTLSTIDDLFFRLVFTYEDEMPKYTRLATWLIKHYIDYGTLEDAEVIGKCDDSDFAKNMEIWLKSIEGNCKVTLGESAKNKIGRLRKTITELHQKTLDQQLLIDRLADCVRDGLEDAYSDINMWKYIASQILANVEGLK